MNALEIPKKWRTKFEMKMKKQTVWIWMNAWFECDKWGDELNSLQLYLFRFPFYLCLPLYSYTFIVIHIFISFNLFLVIFFVIFSSFFHENYVTVQQNVCKKIFSRKTGHEYFCTFYLHDSSIVDCARRKLFNDEKWRRKNKIKKSE